MDASVMLKFIKQLPSQIMASYTKEIKGLDKKEAAAQTTLIQDITSSFISSEYDGSGEPEFAKKYAPTSNLLGEESFLPAILTHDLIGKPLNCFFRQTDPNTDELVDLPHVFVNIRDYFLDDPSRLNNRHLFAKLDRDSMKNVDLLE